MQRVYKLWNKLTTMMLVFVLLAVSMGSGNAMGAASSSTTSNTTRVSVHDPSIYYESSTNKYYIYGSHLAQASSTDLRNWSYEGTQGYANSTLYAPSTFEGYYYIKKKIAAFTWMSPMARLQMGQAYGSGPITALTRKSSELCITATGITISLPPTQPIKVPST